MFSLKKKKKALRSGLRQGAGERSWVSGQAFEVHSGHVIAVVTLNGGTQANFKRQPLSFK